MFWLIWLPIICAIISLIFIDYEETCTRVWGTIGILIGSFLIGLIICSIISSNINPILPTERYISSSKEIIAFKDVSITKGSISGNIFLISGEIEDKLVYRYIVNTNLGMKIETININDVYIKYTDKNPRIETIRARTINPPKQELRWFYYYGTNEDFFISTTIYIPNNSIKTEYKIDLE